MSRYAPMYEMSRPYVYESVWMANARREDRRRQRTVHGRGRMLQEEEEDAVMVLERGVTEIPVLAVSTESWRAVGPQGEREEREVFLDRGEGAERVWTYEPQKTGRDEASQSVERVCSRRGEWRIAGRVVRRGGRERGDSERDRGRQDDRERLPAAVVGAVERQGVSVCGHWSSRERDAVEVAAFTVQYVIESERGDVSVKVVPYLADREEIAAAGSVVYETERRVLRGGERDKIRGGKRGNQRGERGVLKQEVETTVVAHVYAMQDVPRGEWSWYIRHDIEVREERATLRLVAVSGSSFLRR